MSALQVKLIRDVPDPCPECGADVWEVYGNWCKSCAEPVVQAFLKAFGMTDPRVRL